MNHQRITVLQRLGRALIGFALGYVWSSITCLVWLGLLIIGYGDLDEGLEKFKDESWAWVAMVAWLATKISSWVGGTVAPIVIGPTRLRYPIIGSSFLGGMLSVPPAALLTGCLVWDQPPRSELSLLLSIIVGIVVGILMGWKIGRWMTVRERSSNEKV